jgi:hypothetical protein
MMIRRLLLSPLMLVVGWVVVLTVVVLWVVSGEKWRVHLPVETKEAAE